MSMLANQPLVATSRGAGSARLRRFGVPVPPRIAQFFDGPELEAHQDMRATGFEGWSSDTKMKVKWGSGRLNMFHEYASEFEDGAAAKYLPIAALGSETRMFAVDVTDAALPVYFFDYEEGYKKWADDFESFLGKLLKKGQKTPGQILTKAFKQASKQNKASDHEGVIATLEPVLADFPKTADVWDDKRDTLGAAYNLLGIAYEKRPDIPKAMAHYETALELGADSAGLNICDLWLNDFKDYEKLVAYAETRREQIYAFSDKYAWFHIRNYLGQGYLLTKRPMLAVRAYHQILDMLRVEDPAKVKEAVTDLRALIAERPEVDRAAAESILTWLDVPEPQLPPERLAAFRAWWGELPKKVRVALREALNVEGELSDTDFARLAEIDEVNVKHAKLTSIEWVTMLDKLEDVDFEGNQLTDISPLAELPRLTRVDISENKVTSLAPLRELRRIASPGSAGARSIAEGRCGARIERLSAGENPLGSLDGLQGLRELSYLHVIEAGLDSLEPLRGLPELEEVTVYHNKIADLSPLAESPRIKEISSFGNPIARGLAALGALPWLESVDAGDETTAEDVRALRAAIPLIEIDHFYKDDDDASEKPKDQPDPALRAWWQSLNPVWRKAMDSELDRDERGKDPSDEALLKLSREDHLSIDDVALLDLSPLRIFSRVDWLNVGNTQITDITPIAKLPRLRDLLIRDNRVASLAPLRDARVLEELFVERCQLTSLAGLEGCRALRELYAEDNEIEDLGPLGGLADMRVIDLEGNRVASLAPLAKLGKLRELRLGLNRVTDLAPLAGCRELRNLEVWANPAVRGVLALAELPDLASITSHGALPRSEIDELRRLRPDIAIE